jgi:Cu(I)/Ag(I) efflux system membrane fusion protein
MNRNRILANKYLIYAAFIITGMFLGWLFFHSPNKEVKQIESLEQNGETAIWTCAMHPHIRMPEAGKCPICGMDLILQEQSTFQMDPEAVHLTKDAAALANVMTSVVTKKNPVKEVRLYGKVQADERLIQNQTAHVPGRIEELRANFTGERVEKGQVLVKIFSPELIIAQQEMIEASKVKNLQREIYEASKEKLRHWKLTENQINTLEKTGRAEHEIDVLSNTSGIVTSKLINIGDHVTEGAILYQVSDLSKVWILFDAYESDLQFLKKGEVVNFTVQAIPGGKFSGRIEFIDPVIDPVTRVAKIRVEAGNQAGALKPEMFVTGIVKSQLREYRHMLVIPQSAVLWTGERSIVYVKQTDTDEPVFKMREIGIGPLIGNSYVVTDGLREGEEIVTEGTFSVDAAAQLEGKASMMNAELTAKRNVNIEFIVQFTRVIEPYISLKEAFVSGDETKVKQAVRNVQEYLVNVDINLLSDYAHNQWMQINAEMENQLRNMITVNDIEGQRKAFSVLSKELYKAVKSFGLKNKTIYYQFCPMAFNDTGAYWLSNTKEIRNPYFGDRMLTCGDTRETLSY